MDFFHSPKFASRVEELMKKHHIPGLSVALVQDETVASAGFGHATLDPPTQCTADTLFNIASSSKSLTAASVGLLVADDGKYPEVKYDAIVSTLLPDDFVMTGEGYTEGVTVEDILSHRTGMPRHDYSYMGPRAAKPDDARSLTRNLRNLPAAAPIRSKYMYNNIMLTVASHLVEVKSSLSFPDFLEQQFFQPLGMDSTNLQFPRAREKGLSDRIAAGYQWDKDKEEYIDSRFQNYDGPEGQGAGFIVTSANDYIKWVKALMNHEGPITEEVYKGLIRSRTLMRPDYEKLEPFSSTDLYAAGFWVFFYRGNMVVLHDGSDPGFGSRHFFLPAQKFGGVIFGNSAGVGDIIEPFSRELIDEVLKVPEAERLDWSTIQAELNLESEDEDDYEKLRQKICPGIEGSQPQEMPLTAYTGEYWNVGYQGMNVEVKNAKLFIDATDRSMGFTLTFDHVCEQRKYVAHLSDFYVGGDDPIRAEFVIEDSKVVRMGLDLETDMKELIWFDKKEQKQFPVR